MRHRTNKGIVEIGHSHFQTESLIAIRCDKCINLYAYMACNLTMQTESNIKDDFAAHNITVKSRSFETTEDPKQVIDVLFVSRYYNHKSCHS